MGSNFQVLGLTRDVDGSPPSRWVTASVERLRVLTLLMPATYFPSHLTRNLKFLYGSNRCALTANCGAAMVSSCSCALILNFDLTGHLLQVEDHELGRLEWCESHDDVDDAQIPVILCGGFPVALDEIGVAGRLALECSLPEQIVHEGAHVQPDLGIQRLVVGLEDHPLEPAIEAFFDVEGEPPDGNVLVLAGEIIIAVVGAGAPVDDAVGEDTDGVDRSRIGDAVFAVGEFVLQAQHATQIGVRARGGFPDAASAVGAGAEPGDRSGRSYVDLFALTIDGDPR